MKKKVILIASAVTVVIIIVSLAVLNGQGVEVNTAQIVKGNIDKYVEETAVVRMEDQLLLSASAGGRIKEVLKEAGDQVKAGDVLAKLDDQEVLLQIEGLQAQMRSAEARFEEAKSPADKEEINMLKAGLRAAEASYNAAKKKAENNKALYESGAVSMEVYQNSLTFLAGEESNLETARSNLTLAQKGASANVLKQYMGEISQIQSQIDLLEKQSNDLTIKSSIDGVILAREIDDNGFVQPGSPLFEIGNDKGIYLESDILADEVGDVEVGATVLIENEDSNIKNLKGTVRKIYPKAITKMSDLGIEQKRVKVEINLNENSSDMGNIKPGYDLDIKVITASRKNILLIEEGAVFDYQGKPHVFVVENGRAKLREIEKGLESDEKVEVLKGLGEGEEIILSPDETINEGMKVKVLK